MKDDPDRILKYRMRCRMKPEMLYMNIFHIDTIQTDTIQIDTIQIDTIHIDTKENRGQAPVFF